MLLSPHKAMSFYAFEYKGKQKGLSQKLLIKQMAQPFAMQFSTFRENKIKKPQNEAKKSMTKRGSLKSSF